MYVFVYGTLKRGERAAFMMSECVYKGEFFIDGSIYDLGHFPGIKLGGPNVVIGEVYELPSDEATKTRIIERLDTYEGVPRLYQRKQVWAYGDGETIQVGTYEYVPDVVEEWRISSGRWTTIPAQERKAYGESPG